MPVSRMREPTYFILAALQDQDRHGYAIMARAEELSGGRVKLQTGTLYAALDRLTSEGLVHPAGEEIVNGRARRYYALTDAGHAELVAEAQRMSDAAQVVIAAAKPRPALRPRGAPA